MRTKSVLLAAVASIALAGPACAAPTNGWYAAVEAGGNWVAGVDDFETRNAGNTIFHNHVTFDGGWAVLATAGFEWDQWRFEGEAGYRQAPLNAFTTHGTVFPSGGRLDQFTLMANVLYDIPLSNDVFVSIGAGVGADHARFTWDNFGANGLRDEEWRLAYQGIAALNYSLSDRLDAFVDYRFLDMDGPKYATGVYTFQFDNVMSHTLSIGLRCHFAT